MSRTAAAAVAVLALAGCGGSDDDAAGAVVPDVATIVSATSSQPALAFTIEIESGTTVVLAASGLLDVPTLRGHRADASGLAGEGLDAIAEVWLIDGRLSESTDGITTGPIDGGLSDFLGIDDPSPPTTLADVIGNWIGSAQPQSVTAVTVDGVALTQFTLERGERPPLDVWIDSAQRMRRAVEVDEGPQALTTTHQFEYPDSVTIPTMP